MKNVGLDYGAVQMKATCEGKEVIFANKIKADSLMNITDSITVDCKETIFGTGKFDFSKEAKFQQERFIPLVCAALCKISPTEIDFNLNVGIPIHHYKKYAKDIKELINNNKNKLVTYNNVQRIINIHKVDVFPEGIAALYSLDQLTIDKIENREVILIDIGGSTTDICLLAAAKGVNREILNFDSINFGMYNIYHDIKEHIKKVTGDENITVETAQNIIENKQKHFYKEKETSTEFIENIKFNAAMKILGELRMKFPEAINSAAWVCLGGGQKHIFNYLAIANPGAIKNEDLFANARGLENILKVGSGLNG